MQERSIVYQKINHPPLFFPRIRPSDINHLSDKVDMYLKFCPISPAFWNHQGKFIFSGPAPQTVPAGLADR